MRGYNSVFESLQELFPQTDARILKSVAMEHPRDADKAASMVISEVVPLLSSSTLGDDNATQPEREISESPRVCKAEPDEGDLSLTQWLHPSKLPESYLALLSEEPDEKPDLGYVVEKIVLPSRDGAGGGVRTVRSGSEKGGVCSSSVKPSVHVQSSTSNEVSGSSSEVPFGRRPRRKFASPRSQNYAQKLRSWKKQSNNNNNHRDFSQNFGKYRDVSPRQSHRGKSHYCADQRRKQRIDDNIKALAELLPQEVEDDNHESILNEIIPHVKLLQLQMKDLTRSRLGGELVSHPITFVEGYGHYFHHDETVTKSLEEVLEDLLLNDPDGAATLLESKGLHLMPLSTVEGLC